MSYHIYRLVLPLPDFNPFVFVFIDFLFLFSVLLSLTLPTYPPSHFATPKPRIATECRTKEIKLERE